MTRLSRLVGIILHLQGRRLVRAEDMAEYFGVSVRTIYRDLRALEEAGLPVGAEAGKGYSLVEGYHLPPVMFTQEEASAMLVGAQLAQSLVDLSLRPHAHSAFMKISAVLPDDRKEYVERLREATAIHPRRVRPAGEDRANLATVQQAVAQRRVVRITYYNLTRNEVTVRDVEPLGVVYYADNWHMLGFCRLRDGIRDFRADRIERIEMIAEVFPERKDFVLDEHMERFFRGDGESHRVRVLFTRDCVRFATDREYLGFVEERESENGIEMTFEFPDLYHMASWLMSFGPRIRVLEPKELKDLMRGMIEQMLEKLEE